MDLISVDYACLLISSHSEADHSFRSSKCPPKCALHDDFEVVLFAFISQLIHVFINHIFKMEKLKNVQYVRDWKCSIKTNPIMSKFKHVFTILVCSKAILTHQVSLIVIFIVKKCQKNAKFEYIGVFSYMEINTFWGFSSVLLH